MPNLDTIREQLSTANLLYQRQIPAAALEVMALEWVETLGGMADDVFIAAMRRHRQKSPYWPTEAHIISLAGEIEDEWREAERLSRPALPCCTGPLPEEERVRADKWLEKIKNTLAEKMRVRP